MAKKFEIRNSTAEFLIFQIDGKESGVQMVYHDETRARRMIVYHKRKGRFRLFFITLALNKKRLYYVGRADE